MAETKPGTAAGRTGSTGVCGFPFAEQTGRRRTLDRAHDQARFASCGRLCQGQSEIALVKRTGEVLDTARTDRGWLLSR